MHIVGYYSSTKEVIIVMMLLLYDVSSRDSSCRCSGPSEHSVTDKIVLKQVFSLDDDHLCKVSGDVPVVYEKVQKVVQTVVDILICFPTAATNIRGSFDGKIITLETSDVGAYTCSCLGRIDSFQCVPSNDNVLRKMIRVSVDLDDKQERLGWVEYTTSDRTHTYYIMQDPGSQSHSKLFNQRSQRRMTRDTSLNVVSVPSEITQVSSCGVTRGCFRYGKSRDCGHMSCDYFISFRSNVTAGEVDIEISGVTDGWIGIGFSSDKQMGGEDDIITCQRKHPRSNDVIIQQYVSMTRHARPEVQSPHYLNLTEARVSDGHLYCRFSLPFSRPHVNNRRYLDPTNTWYQMYARGPVRMDGVMNKHGTTPLVSDSYVSLLHHINIYTSSAVVYRMQICFILIAQVFCLSSILSR